MKKWILLVLTSALTLCAGAVQAKKEVTRQLGGACGEDSGIVATCASGLSCKSGTCQMNSFLSSATVGCKQAMKDMGDDSKYVAVHDGFCYIDSSCRGLYEKAMRAGSVTPQVITQHGVDPGKLAALSESDRNAFLDAAKSCQDCGKCAIGTQFLGRGGY